jgi:hypothetical protein
MNAPEGFAEEFDIIRQRVEWGLATLGSENHLAHDKIFIEEFRVFYRKWQPLLQDPELREPLEIMHRNIESDFAPKLEALFWSKLKVVIGGRAEWLAAETLFRASVTVAAFLRDMPEEMRAKIMAASREPNIAALLDGERTYREAEQMVNESEAGFRKDLAEFEVDWPERVNTALRQRLEQLDAQGIKAWQAEIEAELIKLQDRTVAEPL